MTPRQRLYEKVKAYTSRLQALRTVSLWWYRKADLSSNNYDLSRLYQRALAAQSLGYEVVLHADDDGLYVRYREKIPEVPHDLR